MKTVPRAERSRRLAALVMAALLVALAGCRRAAPTHQQGYLEGDYVYVGAALAGRVEKLAVQRGARVAAGDVLVTLEREAELAAQREARSRLAQARSRLDDLRKGARPTERAAVEARLAQARTAAELAARELTRGIALHGQKVTSEDELDRVRLAERRAREAVAESEAQLATTELGARTDAIAAAEADVAASTAALERADWSVAQKELRAPADALVFDTIYRAGEFVPAAQPIVSLLPPANLRVRFYVPETSVAQWQPGQRVQVRIDGVATPVEAKITFISPQAEFTPPVIYSREARAKLVFRLEAAFAPEAAAALHPGQPVEVEAAN